MTLSSLIAEARDLDRETFVARHPGWFLVLGDRVDAASLGFRTRVGLVSEAVAAPQAVREVLPIVKAPGHPYPDRISIGRARNCDVVLRHESVSKLHAHVRERPDGALEVIDLQSQNGTRISGRLLAPDVPELLACGDVVAFGSLCALFADADALFDALQG